jgi:hypothetical protein
MRSKALGLNAVVSPPASTPGGRGWTGAGGLTPGVADLLGDASLPSVLGANGPPDVWGSNIDRIRRLEDAATAMPAVSSLSGDGLAGDTDAGPAAGAAGMGSARGDGAALPGDPTVNGYLLLNATAVERSAEHAQRLELENALLRRQLASAEAQLAHLRAQGTGQREETSTIAPPPAIAPSAMEEPAAQ